MPPVLDITVVWRGEGSRTDEMLLFLAAAGGAISSSLPLLPPLPQSHSPATSNRQGRGGKPRATVLSGLAALTPETILWVTRSNPPRRS